MDFSLRQQRLSISASRRFRESRALSGLPRPAHNAPIYVVGAGFASCGLGGSPPGKSRVGPARATDYAASTTDNDILRLDPRMKLYAEDITHVFEYPRNMNDKYSIGMLLGSGAYGVVRECREITTGHRYAVKTIPKVPRRTSCTPRYLIKLRTEVEVMQQLGNSLDAVNLKDVYEDDANVHLVMEVCEGGKLVDRIDSQECSEQYIANIIRGVLRFISQCHGKGFVFRDVKPDNFLFLTTEPDSHLKATDFGLAIKHLPDEPKLKSRSGTPLYMAPELIAQSYDEKCDLWSVGMMTYQLLTGRFPFWESYQGQPLTQILDDVTNKHIDWNAPELEQLSRPAVDFLRGLLERNPVKRLSAVAALQHPWLSDATAAPHTALPLGGSVVQRLQRFSTYGALKQMVLKMMVDEMADGARAELPELSKASLASRDTFDELQHVLESKFNIVRGRNVHCKAVTELLPEMELFQQMDSDKSGDIDAGELAVGLRQLGYDLSDDEVQQLMLRVDLNQDGSVSLREFVTTMMDWGRMQLTQGWQALVERAFAKLDQDADGSISVDDLVHCLTATDNMHMRRLSDEERLAETKALLREVDLNGDGKISAEEFYLLLNQDHLVQDSLSVYDDRLSVNPSASSVLA